MKKSCCDGAHFSACLVAVILLWLGFRNIACLRDPLLDLRGRKTDFSGFVEGVAEAYRSDFSDKNAFIDLNGLFVRAAGRHVSNKILRMPNGMLSQSFPKVDMAEKAENTVLFHDFLKSRGIPFLYVQTPCKMDIENQMLEDRYPGNMSFKGNQNADALLQALEEGGVRILDLRQQLAATPQRVEQFFCRTDHHWNCAGAFAGTQSVEKEITSIFHGGGVNNTCLNANDWEQHLLKSWSLGSYGKRVGRFFGGMDPLLYYTPGFETHLSTAVPGIAGFYAGDFSAANIRSHYLEEPDLYRDSSHYLYIGKDYGLVQHRNPGAPSALRVLMIKDSYVVPVQAFLSTVYREIDVIDPRYFTDCSIAEYVDRFCPDIVVEMLAPDVFGSRYFFEYGIDEITGLPDRDWEPVEAKGAFEVDAGQAQYAFGSYEAELTPGETYLLHFDDVLFLQGEADGTAVSLYSAETQKTLFYGLFDLEYYREKGAFEWIFTAPEDEGDLQLRLYAGIPEATAGNRVEYQGLQLNRLG